MDERWPRGFAEHREAQALRGLRMTPAERLRWLEETMATMRRWVGRAASASAAGEEGRQVEIGPPPARR